MYFNIVKKYNFSLIHAHRSIGGGKSQQKEMKLLIVVVLLSIRRLSNFLISK